MSSGASRKRKRADDWDGKRARDVRRRKEVEIKVQVPAIREYWQGVPLPSRLYRHQDAAALGSNHSHTESYVNVKTGREFGPFRIFFASGALANVWYYSSNVGGFRDTNVGVLHLQFEDSGKPDTEGKLLRYQEFCSPGQFHAIDYSPTSRFEYTWFGSPVMCRVDFYAKYFNPIKAFVSDALGVSAGPDNIVMDYLFLKDDGEEANRKRRQQRLDIVKADCLRRMSDPRRDEEGVPIRFQLQLNWVISTSNLFDPAIMRPVFPANSSFWQLRTSVCNGEIPTEAMIDQISLSM